jgi:hypothetical protein
LNIEKPSNAEPVEQVFQSLFSPEEQTMLDESAAALTELSGRAINPLASLTPLLAGVEQNAPKSGLPLWSSLFLIGK